MLKTYFYSVIHGRLDTALLEHEVKPKVKNLGYHGSNLPPPPPTNDQLLPI